MPMALRPGNSMSIIKGRLPLPFFNRFGKHFFSGIKPAVGFDVKTQQASKTLMAQTITKKQIRESEKREKKIATGRKKKKKGFEVVFDTSCMQRLADRQRLTKNQCDEKNSLLHFRFIVNCQYYQGYWHRPKRPGRFRAIDLSLPPGLLMCV